MNYLDYWCAEMLDAEVNVPTTSLLGAVSANSIFSLRSCDRKTVNFMDESRWRLRKRSWQKADAKPIPRRLYFSSRRIGKQKQLLRYSRGSGESRDLPIHPVHLLLQLLQARIARVARKPIRSLAKLRRLLMLGN
jgi:hypothetical protein